jgi:hypothetical protein
MNGKCPHCNSTNLSTEPVYLDDEEWEYGVDDENDPSGQIAVFCVTCGHYLGTIQSELRGKLDHDTFVRQLYLRSATE